MFFGHSWSLAVEEWFYLLFPISLYILVNLIKFKFKWSLLLVVISIIFYTTFLRYMYYENVVDLSDIKNQFTLFYSVLYRFDGIVYGVFGAYISYYYPIIFKKYKIILFIIGLIMFLIYIFF